MQATPDVSLLKTLKELARDDPERVYVQAVDGGVMTCGGALEQSLRWADAYRKLGVERGAHVVTMQYNTMESLCGWLGLAWLGAVEAPINNDYRSQLLVHALNLTRARTMLLMEQYLDRVLEVASDLEFLEELVIVDGATPRDSGRFRAIGREDFLRGATPADNVDLPRPWDIMAVLFTSGTTGPSKAVRLPWAQIHAMTIGTFPQQDLGPSDVFYSAGPTYHVGAKVFPYMAALCGGRLTMRPFISRTQVADDFDRFGVTTGPMPLAWLDEAPGPRDRQRSLKNMLVINRDPRADVFVKRFGARRMCVFNMTEVSCPIGLRTWEDLIIDAEGRMSCGVVRKGYEARIVDEHDQPVRLGQVGELIVRADTPWVLNAGYLNNPEATNQAWRNGWFHTGDAFIQDASGNFFFLDRLKDCIRRHAENISSFEVESYVNAHPAVAGSAAVAIKTSRHPGADEEIKIVVQTVPGERLAPEDLIHWLIPRMPRFMVPRYVEFMDALPLTPTQKVRKAVLRDRGVGPDVWDREAAGIEVPR